MVVFEIVSEEFGLIFDLVRHKGLDEVPCFAVAQRHLRLHDRGEDGLRSFECGIRLPLGIVKDDSDAPLATVLRDVAAEGDPFTDDGDVFDGFGRMFAKDLSPFSDDHVVATDADRCAGLCNDEIEGSFPLVKLLPAWLGRG